METTPTKIFDPSIYGVISHLIQNKTTTFLYPPKEKQHTKSRMYPAFLSASSWLVLMAFITTVEPAKNQQTTNIKLFLKMQAKSTKKQQPLLFQPHQPETNNNSTHWRKHKRKSITPSVITRINIFDIKVNDQRKACTWNGVKLKGFFVNTFTFFLVKNHMDTKCMWISL